MRTFRCPPTFLFSVLLLLILPAVSARAVQITKHTDSYGREYFVYAPDKVDPNRTYWLVAEIGAFQGITVGTRANGNSGGLRGWVDRGDCIGVSAAMPENYQVLEYNTDAQLLGIFHKLQGEFSLHKKLFLYGHSGGAQFAHRFALAHPRDVAGCCATSAGSWADGFSGSASTVPIGVSCGEADTAFSAPGDPMTRIVWAHKFAKELEREHFFYKAKFWPGAGHGGDGRGNAELTDEAFSLGTSGMVGEDYHNVAGKLREFSQAVAGHDANRAKSLSTEILNILNTAPTDDQVQQALTANGWTARPAAIAACQQTRQDFVAEKTKWLSDTLPSAGTPSAETATTTAPSSGAPSSDSPGTTPSSPAPATPSAAPGIDDP